MKAKTFELLDCTLRDGGYYTNWDFEDQLIEKYMAVMQQLPIDILEIGYRSTPQKQYMGKYFYFPDFAIEKIASLNTHKRLALMFNEKNTRPEHLDKMLQGLNGKIDLIRLAVNPENFDRAVELGEAIKKRGFNITFNVMYMSRFYKDQKFLEKLGRLNGLVSYLNLVDSYGGMLPDDVKTLVVNAKEYCKEAVGFHGHDNLELAFASTLAAIDAGCNIVDGTIMGMGRGAGNLKTELLLTHLISKGLVNFNFNLLSSLVEAWTPLHEEYQWGTNLPYMVSGANSLPQADVMEWVTQRFYSFNSIIRALHNQKTGDPDNVKLPVFNPEVSFKNVIIIGGGPNAMLHAEAVKRFIDSMSEVCIVHASSKNAKYYENTNVPQYFCLVGNEGHRLEDVFDNLENFGGQCVLPPYPRKMGTYIPEMAKKVSFELKEVSFTDKYMDAHTSLALQTSLVLNSKNVYLAGYDGYSNEMITSKEQGLISENEYLFSRFEKLVSFSSILTTNYPLDVQSVYSLI